MELIKITEINGNQVVSARELYEVLGYNSTQWKRWYEKNIINNEFAIEEEDYIGFDTMSSGNKTKDFALKIEFAKKLSMMARTENGETARAYFIECEKKLKSQVSIPSSYAEALLEAGRLALEVETKNKTIELMQPKAEFFDQVVGSDTCFDMADVAKVCNLGIGRNTLFQFLRDNKVLRDNNTPFQQYIDCGYFRVIESKYNKPDGSVNISLKTVVYQKGIDFIIKRFVGRKLNVA